MCASKNEHSKPMGGDSKLEKYSVIQDTQLSRIIQKLIAEGAKEENINEIIELKNLYELEKEMASEDNREPRPSTATVRGLGILYEVSYKDGVYSVRKINELKSPKDN